MPILQPCGPGAPETGLDWNETRQSLIDANKGRRRLFGWPLRFSAGPAPQITSVRLDRVDDVLLQVAINGHRRPAANVKQCTTSKRKHGENIEVRIIPMAARMRFWEQLSWLDCRENAGAFRWCESIEYKLWLCQLLNLQLYRDFNYWNT